MAEIDQSKGVGNIAAIPFGFGLRCEISGSLRVCVNLCEYLLSVFEVAVVVHRLGETQ